MSVRKVKSLLAVAFGMLLVSSAFSFDLENVVNPTRLDELKKEGFIQDYYFKKQDVKLTLVPRTSLQDTVLNSWIVNEQPCFIIENLYLIPKKSLGDGSGKNSTIEYTSKIMRKISKLEGVEYYSHSDNKYKVLYKDAYCVDGPKSKHKIPDSTDGSAEGKKLFAIMNDCSFGKSNYEMNYREKDGEVLGTFTNTTPMYVGPINAVDVNRLIVNMMVVDCGEDLVFYLVCEAKVPAIDFLEGMMYDSFSARLEACYNWLMLQY